MYTITHVQCFIGVSEFTYMFVCTLIHVDTYSHVHTAAVSSRFSPPLPSFPPPPSPHLPPLTFFALMLLAPTTHVQLLLVVSPLFLRFINQSQCCQECSILSSDKEDYREKVI